nr:VP4 [Rotavirus A]
MASLAYRQLLENCYSTELQDEIANVGITTTHETNYVPGPYDDAMLGPTDWGPGITPDSEYIPPKLQGPYQPSTFDTDEGLWFLAQPERTEIVAVIDQNCIVTIYPNESITTTVEIRGNQHHINQRNDLSNLYQTYHYTLKDNALVYHGSYTSIKPISMFRTNSVHIPVNRQNGEDGYVPLAGIPNVNKTVRVNAEFYINNTYSFTELAKFLTGELKLDPAEDISSFMVPLKYNVTNRTFSASKPNEDVVVSRAALWKEVDYRRDIELQFKFGNSVINKGGLGYKWSQVVFKPANHQYSYTRDGRTVNAHTTCSVNGVSKMTFNGGSLPTDFYVDEFQWIEDGAYVFIDYWDDSQVFQNLVYVRNANAQVNNVKVYNKRDSCFALPAGAWPCVREGWAELVLHNVMLATQFTDYVALNSLRFIFQVKGVSNWYVERMPIHGWGLTAKAPNGEDGSPPYTTQGRFSIISLVPANDDYRIPTDATSTVRQDLEQQINELRSEFNELSQSIAVSQIIDLAMLPLDMFSMFNAVTNTLKTAKSITVKVMRRLKNSRIASDVAQTSSRLSRLRSIGSTISRNLDEIADVPSRRASTISRASNSTEYLEMRPILRSREFSTQTNSLSFDDISAAVLKTKIDNSTQTVAKQLADVSVDAINDFIPNRSYRFIDGANAFEVDGFGKFMAYKVDTLEEIIFDMDRFKELVTDSPVISAIIDFKTLKNLNDNFGISKQAAYDLLLSNPHTLKEFINKNNPIIKNRIEQLIMQCKI